LCADCVRRLGARERRAVRERDRRFGASRTLKEETCRKLFGGGAVREMEDCWPSGVGPRGRALNHPVLRWLKTVVVSDRGKGAA
jgi:hypothetical protein